MGSLGSFLFVYALGGITFIPLVLSLILLYAYFTFQTAPQAQQSCAKATDPIRQPTDDDYSLKSGTDQLAEKFHRTHESDVAAGYFAVCREYVPGGVNGKPPERTTPAGEVVATESPSVYQAMYRSLFDRKQTPSIEPAKSNGKTTKRARNVFYIVLRHGHLMLYDDENQVEVRYVISLAHHDVTIYGGEGEIPEGELWLKRNAICLSRRLDSLGDLGGPTPPFYLFSENLSEKEDFYIAMLRNQNRLWDSPDRPPKHQEFDTKHIVTLVQRLHSSEEQLQTRWINAFLGRLFLALYRTPELEEFVRSKIVKKISRVNKPNFISKVGLQRIDMGEGAPFITNPRLKDLTVDGNCCVEADLQYTGNFRVEISATVRIDLGPRFKAREVDIVLAVVLKKLEGHLLVRFKPPPSNRIWMSFETMPKMEMDIEPIVSSKQITYSLILRTIESKIREVVAESIVLPFWDDVPFHDTLGQAFRGGIWQRDAPDSGDQVEIPDESGEAPATPKSVGGDPLEILKSKDDRTMSMPTLSESATTKKKPRKGPKSSLSDLQTYSSAAISTGIERPESTPLPRAIRSQTFSNAADPVVTADNAKVDKVVTENKGDEKSHATSAMIEISNRSPPTSPNRTPSSSPPTGGITVPESVVHSRESSIAECIDSANFRNDNGIQRPSATRMESNSFSSMRSSRGSSTTSLISDKARRRSTIETITKSFTSSTSSDDKPSGSITIGSATAAAKKWSWSVFGKGDLNMGQESSQAPAGTLDQPIGRGHPHPPPGTPLPRPDKYALKRNPTSLPKRKPVGTHTESERPKTGDSQAPPSPLPRRKPMRPGVHTNESTDELLVVEAPQDSEPNSPAPGDLDSDQSLKKSTLVESETSSKAEQSGLDHEEKEEASEEASDVEPIGSVDQKPSTLGSNEALLSERLEVPAS
ncbi:uncharacterized protein N7446_004603 [Penicillium canescens]|uniref:SMP-LTD domain-containing protein n=1 Tax=Penicillium canescens TaxID=5083 RepID=A0AAD6I1J6_PENCN|nr:uncharacterized protein N7446_004603 [Penicillium canescens]KAJ6026797.1 hypothetical protein N7460_011614 [Penicillium canescens]KAJ6040082.1 hypothetical protein N7444_008987 [Penicillium canescens]KAJ6067566.1 hypothetical protein N7446_004603 [Penicillium canescens]